MSVTELALFLTSIILVVALPVLEIQIIVQIIHVLVYAIQAITVTHLITLQLLLARDAMGARVDVLATVKAHAQLDAPAVVIITIVAEEVLRLQQHRQMALLKYKR